VISRAIYYPYIKVPQSSWFTRVLLYWDEVGAIVPYEFLEDPQRLGPYMVSLVREQLVQQVHPGAFLWKVPHFADAFLKHVDHLNLDPNAHRLVWPRIHMEKLQGVAEPLCDRGFARRTPNEASYSPWYEIEPSVADDFMAYLAAVLGQLPDENPMSPVTDYHAHLLSFGTESGDRKASVRETVLEGILPGPAGPVEPPRLAEFKAKYQAELRRFRMEVEEKISELSVIDDAKTRAARVIDATEYLRIAVDELAARIREQKAWPRIDFGTLCALGAAGATSVDVMTAAGGKWAVAGAAIGVAGAVFSAFQRSSLLDRPLAYAAIAKQM